MNKYQEAFELLYYFLDKTILYQKLAKYNARKQLEILEELVDKATLKKPIEKLSDCYCGEIPSEKELHYYCECGEWIGDEAKKYNYCPSCGQMIDWSDEND